MKHLRIVIGGLATIVIGWTNPVLGGMPQPELIFTELGRRRWEEVSFFLVGFLAMSAIVKILWNLLRRDFPAIPKLSFGRSVSLLVLWGLVMSIVLALISGARELMTPGAWVPNGVAYKLASDQSKNAVQAIDEPQDRRRRLRLENLRFALWQFATSHEGRFPSATECEAISPQLWLVETTSPLRFIYIPDHHMQQTEAVLVYEPEVFDDGQYVMLTTGAIAKLSDASIPINRESGRATGAIDTTVSDETPVDANRPSNLNNGR